MDKSGKNKPFKINQKCFICDVTFWKKIFANFFWGTNKVSFSKWKSALVNLEIAIFLFTSVISVEREKETKNVNEIFFIYIQNPFETNFISYKCTINDPSKIFKRIASLVSLFIFKAKISPTLHPDITTSSEECSVHLNLKM